ncbi:MAG: DDE-type integrase/transposase/recombinase [bacterium]
MNKINRFVIWICSKFTRNDIEKIIQGLLDVLSKRNPNIKLKDNFKEKHPNYRNFSVDPNPPIPANQTSIPKLNWKNLINEYQLKHKKPLKPINPKKSSTKMSSNSFCEFCNAPSEYLYFNDGKKQSQIKCKVCSHLSQLNPRKYLQTKYFCPYCKHSLSLWKKRKDVLIYKCNYHKCSFFLSNKNKLNSHEKLLFTIKPFQFKLHYQFREYHFTNQQLIHSAPEKNLAIFNIRNSMNTLCLALTFHISMGISARKTAYILRNVFSLKVSYQTVLNYTQSTASYCHQFNLTHKGDVDDIQAGDETYIKISGKNAFVTFFISSKNRKITAYHIDNTRDTLPAIISMNEAIRTANPDQKITLITDGNPSYPAGIHYINQLHSSNLIYKKVIGLQNLDSESTEFRPFKQLIERLNRTYKFHIKAACGFNSKYGAIALTTLFVTHYNFLRPHFSLNYSVPIPLPQLNNISIQGKWAKILQMAFNLSAA